MNRHKPLLEFVKQERDEQFLQRLNEWLKPFRAETSRKHPHPQSVPVIYIVGAPRSGTTLLSQILVKYFQPRYINNLMARFWLNPDVGIALSHILLPPHAQHHIDLSSTHGVTSSLAGPHEFGYFWTHWLRLDNARTHRLDAGELASVDRDGLKSTLENDILSASEVPFVFKNPICGLNAFFLSQIHPLSLFVEIRRNPREAAISILHARFKRFGAYEAWWSLKPSTYENILTPDNPSLEVARQVHDCRRELRDELRRPGVHAVTLDYETLCADPETTLYAIVNAVRDIGGNLARNDIPIAPLHRSSPPPIKPEMAEIIENFFNTHSSDEP
ncbi:MAG: sulfotransferase [Planctomycetota bacterium]